MPIGFEESLLLPVEGMVCVLILIPVIVLLFIAFAGFMKVCFWVFKGAEREVWK